MNRADHAQSSAPHFGARLRELRGDRSLDEFGRMIGLSASGVRKLESNPRANPRLDTLLGIQRAFGFASIEEVFGRFPSAVLAANRRAAMMAEQLIDRG